MGCWANMAMNPKAHPHWFGRSLPEGGLFGHLHVPEDGHGRGPAVLVCGTFGYEDMSSHRSLRMLARQLAEQGSVCLHFDQVGVGDSADVLMPDAHDSSEPVGGMAAWPVAIGQAIDHLKQVTGATQVVVVGLRMGATMTCLAASGRDDIQALVALSPVLRGKAFVREAKVLGQATLARTGMSQPDASDGLEFGGYSLSSDDVRCLQSIDLTRGALPGVPQVLLLERDDMAPDSAWAERWRESGAAVEQVVLPGYQAMMQVPHLSVPPHEILDHVAAWVGDLTVSHAAAPVAVHALRHRLLVPHQSVIETAGWLQGVSPLSVIVSTPACLAAQGAKARPAVLMINTGGERRIGTNRMYTRWSRTWADRGWTAMRMDLSGLGHSPARQGHPHGIHLRHAKEDIRVAVEHLRQAHGATQVHLIGLCSGAFHALHSVFEGQALDSVTAINQMVYFWQENMPIEGEQSEAVTVAITQGMKTSLLDPWRWLKLFKGQVNVSLILRALLRRMRQHAALTVRAWARSLGLPLAHDLHSELLRAAHRGVHMHLVFAAGESGLTMARAHAPKALEKLTGHGHLQLSVMQNADHTFTSSESQKRLFQVVDAHLQSLAARPHAATHFQQALSDLCPTP